MLAVRSLLFMSDKIYYVANSPLSSEQYYTHTQHSILPHIVTTVPPYMTSFIYILGQSECVKLVAYVHT